MGWLGKRSGAAAATPPWFIISNGPWGQRSPTRAPMSVSSSVPTPSATRQLAIRTPTNAMRLGLPNPARRAHSPAASAIGKLVSNCQPALGSKNRQASSSDNSTLAVSTRCLSEDPAAAGSAAIGLAGVPTGLTQ